MRNDQIHIRLKPNPTALRTIRHVFHCDREGAPVTDQGISVADGHNRLGRKQNARLQQAEHGFQGSLMSQNANLLWSPKKIRHLQIWGKPSSSAPKWDEPESWLGLFEQFLGAS
jgi:hypothetical protein